MKAPEEEVDEEEEMGSVWFLEDAFNDIRKKVLIEF